MHNPQSLSARIVSFFIELMLGEPAARALVQLRDARRVATQDAAREIQEQRVIAIPVPVTVEHA
ncbi:MAG: hypothetical protein ACREXP_05185 [Steroidobacteraceae bacterium]